MIPPQALLEAAERWWGGPLSPAWVSGPHSEAAVWALYVVGPDDLTARPQAWLKLHKHRGKVDAEARAHQIWLPQAGLRGAWIQRLSDTACLLRHCEGRPLSDPALAADVRLAAWGALGAAIRALHRVPLVDDDPIPLREAWVLREAAWLDRARGILTPTLWISCKEVMRAPVPAGHRVPCHRDLRPDNVIVDDQGRVSLLDFGQSRPDSPVADWVKLLERPDGLPSGCQAAFEAGYGASADQIGGGMLSRARLLHGISTAVWAHQKGDQAGVRLGMSIILQCVT